MKFSVRSTSVWDDEKQPCPEATLESYIYQDWRFFTNLSEASSHVQNTWYGSGKNHRKAPSPRAGDDREVMVRDFERQRWTVEIDDLEDLMGFIGRHGTVVIEPDISAADGVHMLEIYDDYRE